MQNYTPAKKLIKNTRAASNTASKIHEAKMNRIPKNPQLKSKTQYLSITDRTMTADNQGWNRAEVNTINQYKPTAMSLKHSTQKEQICICPQLLTKYLPRQTIFWTIK